MRVLDLTVRCGPLFRLIGASERVGGAQLAAQEWCVHFLPALRARARLTQDQMAEALGFSRQAYQLVETGDVPPSPTFAANLVAWLSIQPGER